jgi:peptidoglycan-associated lipoprotein
MGVAGLPGPAGPAGPQGIPGPAAARAVEAPAPPIGDVQFDLDRADLRPSEAKRVAQLAAYLKEHPAFHVELEGFADPRGSQAYNLRLSGRRVNAVRDALVAAGVPKEQIRVGAYGELNPRCAQASEECWQQNRRVEVIVLPAGDVKAASLRAGNGR